MTTDKELLELAAKAAGIEGEWVQDPAYRWQERWYFNVPYDSQNMLTGFEWNPLTDDGDAFRLAVKLRFHVSVFEDAIGIGSNGNRYEEMKWSDDPYAATRRAVVRAAADIGETK